MTNRTIKKLVAALLVALFVYAAAAELVFRFRHPWMTEDERAVYTFRALAFGRVPYAEARPR